MKKKAFQQKNIDKIQLLFSYKVIWPQIIVITCKLCYLTPKTMSRDSLTQFRWKSSLPTPFKKKTMQLEED